jgi:hypothetical protein
LLPATADDSVPRAKGAPVALDVANLFDQMQRFLKLRNDAGLASMLRVSPSVISRTRSRHIRMTASLLLRLHEVSGVSIQELRGMLGLAHGAFWECTQLLVDEAGPRSRACR